MSHIEALTTLAPYFTAIAAITAPVATALITQHSAYKIKFAELSFQAKVDAYLNFLTFTASFPCKPTKEDLLQLEEYSSAVLMFAPKEAQAQLSIYGNLLVKGFATKAQGAVVGRARGRCILAFQKDLNHSYKYNKPKRG